MVAVLRKFVPTILLINKLQSGTCIFKYIITSIVQPPHARVCVCVCVCVCVSGGGVAWAFPI